MALHAVAEIVARWEATFEWEMPRVLLERIAARDPDPQTAETHIRRALVNSFNTLSPAETVRVA